MTTLEKIQDVLISEGFDCTVVGATEECPFPSILLTLGLDPQERERTLQINHIEQIVPPAGYDEFCLFEFRYQFPFQVLDRMCADMARLVASLNQGLEFPGFEYDEVEGRIGWRHVLFDLGTDEHYIITRSLIGTLMMELDVYSGAIEEVATGKTTFLQLMQWVVEAAGQEV